MSWEYANLSHTAKEYGGPEGLVTAIYNGGLVEGRIQGGAIAGLMMLSAGGFAFLINRAVEYKRTRAAVAKGILIDRLDSKEAETAKLSGENAQLDKTNSNAN